MRHLFCVILGALLGISACSTTQPPPSIAQSLPYARVVGDEIHLDAVAGTPEAGDASGQARASIAAIRSTLEAQSAGLGDVVQLLVLLTDLHDKADVISVLNESFDGVAPPVTVIETAAVSRPDAVLEIEAFAIRGASERQRRVQFGGPGEVVVRVDDRVFVSGIAASGAGPADDVDERHFIQARDALARLEQSLDAVGARPEHVTRARAFTLDFGFFGAVARAHGAMFGEIRPAAALLPVNAVGIADEVFLIQANAVVSDDRQLISSGTKWEPMYGYSRAVRAGDSLQVSATAPWLPEGGYADPNDIVAQARQILINVKAALDEAGADYSDISRLRLFMLDPLQINKVEPVLAEIFGKNRPAITVITLQGMADPEVLLEIEMEAVVRERMRPQ